MALINAKVSQAIWYGLMGGLTYTALTMYKPKYYFCMANVKHI